MSKYEAIKKRRRSDYSLRHHPSSGSSSPSKVGRNNINWQITKNFLLPLVLCIGAVSFYAFLHGQWWFTVLHDPLKKSELPKALVEDLYNQTNWSTFRPQLYFGLKTKHPKSPLFGLLWYEQPQEEVIRRLSIRHWCDHGDNVRFSWTAHDGRTFGRQHIEDGDLLMRIDWMANGRRSWNVHISAQANHSHAMVFYLALQDQETELVARNEFRTAGSSSDHSKNFGPLVEGDGLFRTSQWPNSYSHPIAQQVRSELRIFGRPFPPFRRFQIKSALAPGARPREAISAAAYKIPPMMDMRRVDELLKASMGRIPQRSGMDLVLFQNDKLPGPEKGGANYAAIQITFSGSFSIDLELITNGDAQLDNFEAEFERKLAAFEQKFNDIFQIEYQLPDRSREEFHSLGQAALANVLGGVGVWHGHSLARSSPSDPVRPYGPLSLISAVPSRPFFPRGFLWDEGFHNLIIRHFDPQLTLQIFASWLDLLSVDGWIPREMILGEEAQAKVPPEFLVQSPSVANPPMFFFVLEKFVRNSEMFSRHSARLALLYPRLKQFYVWLRRTQQGPRVGTMQWQGRNRTIDTELNPKTLASGLDDFPRASHPSAEEYHLDLRCWMALSSRVLRQLAETFDDSAWVPTVEEDVRQFNDPAQLDALHWSETLDGYADFGMHSGRVQLVQEIVKKRPAQGQHQQSPQEQVLWRRQTVEQPRLRLVDDVYGYGNLFPLLLRLLPADSARLGILLKSLNQTELLWSPFGLRSLSTKSPYYRARNTEHDAPYWRGAIWININYLALDALHSYADRGGPFARLSAELYGQLRDNLVRNVAEQFQRTGFLWEQYDDHTGEGMGTRPFAGWSALIVNILAEKFD